ncbi:LON peptidase N-terminal domain and RING finger protein 2 [Branchiostoma belcheri]|nr:LON peptidase N-terminal domain and RING finger protein 2 [Branchiostoma belcheri]
MTLPMFASVECAKRRDDELTDLLAVSGPPWLLLPMPDTRTHSAGQEVRLQCAVKGEEPITYRWLKNDNALELNSRQAPYEVDAGTLIIKNPEKSRNEGGYQCVAENKHGTVHSHSTALRFSYVNPFASTPRPPVTVRQEEGAVLRCQKPEAYPGLIFFWVESVTLDPAFRGSDQRVYVSQKTGDLYFARAEPSDEGKYQCVIRLSLEGSELRYLSPTNSFSISGQASSQSATSLVLYEGATIEAAARTTVVMEAFAYGNPIPTLTWRRLDAQGNVVAMPPSSRLTMETFKRSLTITDVRSEDAGFYEVRASNNLRSQTRRTQLIVQAIPDLIRLERNIFRQGLGASVTFGAGWRSSEPVTITWLHNGRILTEGGRYRMTRSDNTASLQIINLVEEDSGIYQCSIGNTYGTAYGSGSLLYSGAPSYLTNFRRTESGDSYAVFVWGLPEGSTITDIRRYQFFVTPKGGGYTRIINVPPEETTVRIDSFSNHSSNYIIEGRANSKTLDIPGEPMDKHHREMLKLYRPDAVEYVNRPDRVFMYLTSINVLPASVIKVINKQHYTKDQYNRKIVDTLIQHGGNDAFKGYCSSLRKEKLFWLADTLEGQGLSIYRRELLTRHQSVLVERMDPDITLAHLSKQRVFTSAMTEYVSSATSREEKNRRILHLLQSRSDDEFSVFLDALRLNESQPPLVDLFEPSQVTLPAGPGKQPKPQPWPGQLQQPAWNGGGQLQQSAWNGGGQLQQQSAWNSGGQLQQPAWNSGGQLQQQSAWNGGGQLQQSAWNGGQISGSKVYIHQQTNLKGVTAKKGLHFTDPSIKSGASTMVQIGQPVILEVNGEGTTPDGAMLSCDINITSMDPKMAM